VFPFGQLSQWLWLIAISQGRCGIVCDANPSANAGVRLFKKEFLIMTIRQMTSDEQMAFKNLTDNLALMKRQQWLIASTAVALIVGLFGLTQGKQFKPPAICLMCGFVIVVAAYCSFWVLRIQNEMKQVRHLMSEATTVYFTQEQRERFDLDDKNPGWRGWEFPVAFIFIFWITAIFAILFWTLP
jgi:hypothetical protein